MVMNGFDDKGFYERLIGLSLEDYYNPFDYFDWPDTLPTDVFWISPELLTIVDTPWESRLTEAEKIRLSIYETLNLFSLTFHGEQNIKADTMGYVEKRGFEGPSDYLQIFLREENAHMYLFSKFCKKYGGKLYPMRQLPVEVVENADLRRFLVFAKAIIAEEVIDTLNIRMMKDARIPRFIRDICERHHRDESRHIAMGRRLITSLWQKAEESTASSLAIIAAQSLAIFGEAFLAHLYNPDAYRDAGFESPYRLRRDLLTSPARSIFHAHLLKRPWNYFARLGLPVEQYWKALPYRFGSNSIDHML
jgi:hypothetical protein